MFGLKRLYNLSRDCNCVLRILRTYRSFNYLSICLAGNGYITYLGADVRNCNCVLRILVHPKISLFSLCVYLMQLHMGICASPPPEFQVAPQSYGTGSNLNIWSLKKVLYRGSLPYANFITVVFQNNPYIYLWLIRFFGLFLSLMQFFG